MEFAGIEPIIAILVAVGWFIVKALFDRRRDADEWTEMELPRPARTAVPPPPPPRPPIQRTIPPAAPAAGRIPPPIARRPEIIRPVIVHDEEGPSRADTARFKESRELYARAAHLQQAVASRFSAIDQQTASAKPTQPQNRMRPVAAPEVMRMFRNPTTIRQAFLAQFVLNPPKALE